MYTTTIKGTKLTAKKGEANVSYHNGRTEVGLNCETLISYEHFLQQCDKCKHQIKIHEC